MTSSGSVDRIRASLPGEIYRHRCYGRFARAAVCIATTHVSVWAAGTAVAATTVDVARHGRGYQIQASAQTRADVDTAWHTLTDYEAMPRFVPNISSARVLKRWRRNGLERLLLEQRGEFRFLFFAQPVTVRMDVMHRPPLRVEARSAPAAEGSDTDVEAIESRYEIEHTADGARVRYVARIVPRFSLPPLVGTLAVRNAVRTQFDAMLGEIERRQRALSLSAGRTR